MEWARIALGGTPALGQIRVSYGHKHIPHPGEPAHGGMVKFQRLQNEFPNSPWCFNILYMGSSSIPAGWQKLLELARHKGARLVWNQDGVGYPGWHGPGWEKFNLPMAKIVHEADYVFYQSRFCKHSADHFLGERKERWEILYNAVDTRVFKPTRFNPNSLVLLSCGSIGDFYRFRVLVSATALVAQFRPEIRLIVAGRLVWAPDQAQVFREASRLIDDLCMRDRVILEPPYLQTNAPFIFQRAHILLHTQYNDACPTTVIEAMASGLPVVYLNSGGTPELVGEEAGIGIPAELSWEQIHLPDSSVFAEAVLQVAEQRAKYAEAARQRAEEHFDIRPWLQRHREVFEELVALQ